MVAQEAALLGRPHATLRWQWDGQGNLQEAAREARLRLIDRWRCGIEHVLFAHTQNDLVETFLMRLKRGSGVEGLAAMSASRAVVAHGQGKPGLAPEEVVQTETPPIPQRRVAGVPAYSRDFQALRPLLGTSRAELRHRNHVLKVPFVDDPSNEDRRFERIAVRKEIAALGLDMDRLAETARAMASAREALERRASEQAEALSTTEFGDILLARSGFEELERDTQERLLAGALCYVSGISLRPRRASLRALMDRVLGGGQDTLHGCVARMERDQLRICREYNALHMREVAIGTLWDGRWDSRGRDPSLRVRALGKEGAAQLPNRPENLPFVSLIAQPAVFEAERLVACPAADFGPSGMIYPHLGHPSFALSLLSH